MSRDRAPLGMLECWAAAASHADAIRGFLEFIGTRGVRLATYSSPPCGGMQVVPESQCSDLLYAYFDVDRRALEAERRALLEAARRTVASGVDQASPAGGREDGPGPESTP